MQILCAKFKHNLDKLLRSFLFVMLHMHIILISERETKAAKAIPRGDHTI